MSIPVKYLEENLIFNKNGDVFAYYEWEPYNYSFIGADKALTISEHIERLVAQSQAERFEFLFVSDEESISDAIERSKKLVKGDLEELAFTHLDGIKEHLQNVNGEYELGYKFYVGFLLSQNDEFDKPSLSDEFRAGLSDLKNSLNKAMFNDYTVMPNKEIERFLRLEDLLYHKISKYFSLRKITVEDSAYLFKHNDGQRGVARSDYSYEPHVQMDDDQTIIKAYDVERLSSGYYEENERFMKLITDETTQYVSYLSVSNIVGETTFPFGSEVFYYQQSTFDFPVDVSIKVKRIDNKDALGVIRTKKMELKDLDLSALESGNDSSTNLLDARDDANELEAGLEKTKEDFYEFSYVIRVSAESKEDLSKRVSEVKDFYKTFNMLVERPLGDQYGLYEEFYPSNPRHMNDYVQYAEANFFAGLGFGATQTVGDSEGIPIGYNLDTGRTVYIQPWLAAQGVEGTVTNALAKSITGSLGGGKSVLMNLIAYYSVLFGAKGMILDPKGERINWIDDLDYLGDALNVINITSDEENRGLLDPFLIMDDVKDAEALALEILSFMIGVGSRDSDKFPVLRSAVGLVANYPERRGMLHIIEELKIMNTPVSLSLASHIESLTDVSISSLIFSDGTKRKSLSIDGKLNVPLVQDLILPEGENPAEFLPVEVLSIAVQMILANFALELVKEDRSIFKFVDLDEAWSWLRVLQGKILADKLNREGRQKNASIGYSTQNTDDLEGEKMKSNIGMKFAFRSTDSVEIEKTLRYFGLENDEVNASSMRNLQNGDCLFQDIYGNIARIHIDYVFEDLFKAFDTRPPMEATEV